MFPTFLPWIFISSILFSLSPFFCLSSLKVSLLFHGFYITFEFTFFGKYDQTLLIKITLKGSRDHNFQTAVLSREKHAGIFAIANWIISGILGAAHEKQKLPQSKRCFASYRKRRSADKNKGDLFLKIIVNLKQ